MINPSIKNDFPILSIKVNEKPLIYFDNCATTHKPNIVIDKLVEYYKQTNANIHRGIHYLSEKATEEYEESKQKVAKFINARSEKEIIYTRNTTESINLVAYSWGAANLKKGDLVLSTELEHHSNIVPWQILRDKIGIQLEYIPIKDDFSIDQDKYDKLLLKKPKLVTFVHASNVTGTVTQAKEIIGKAREAGAITLLDAAQSVPHMKTDVQNCNCDFLVFSAHKMCGPTGIGVLYGKKEILEDMPPFLGGGEMIKSVSYEKSSWNNLPWKFEAGTPNVAAGVGFGTTIDYLSKIGIEKIEEYERDLTSYALKRLEEIKGLKVFGQGDSREKRGSMISFTMENVHPHDIAQVLNDDGIAIRSGHHCAQPLHKKFKIPATARVSFYFYNNKEEIDKMIESLHKVLNIFK